MFKTLAVGAAQMMGDVVGLEQLQSLPMQLRRLLETADDPACDQAWPESLEPSSPLILAVARPTRELNIDTAMREPLSARGGKENANCACSTPAIRRVP